ncbi:mevalonate kinase [Candidatus Marsarchaeota G2 archaeon OSP_D]|uniref:Mevalonate kinase n=3 Tax=Candidatus Marsarchaeota group 2 TaxID=2203771 RepID=A0A2R6B8W5_9ARCH|nr:MAG: mevalonate kinase [Candidatus Marsarchaeota G2 archaeon OSP_D]PSN91436.1 MAG: mevalonate kinase [Candidatus Marsarchaeota G2 archaeon ECH_B_SAG-M15]PSN95079.1 MAG: mevalonate kinase [Candidatus Marsarchaeota G2 archaeon ECH_B_SAG-C16]
METLKAIGVGVIHVRVSASAPGKITLFGEHAVVYGKPAIVMAINRRIRVELSRRNDGRLVIDLPDISVKGVRLTINLAGGSSMEALDSGSAASYALQALKLASEKFGGDLGLDVKIESSMPVGAGLGTSAALSVATLAAYAALQGFEPTRDALAKMGREVEVAVQGSSSGMDAAAAAYGGAILYRHVKGDAQIERLSFGERIILAVGYTERVLPTSESVKLVSKIFSKHNSTVIRVLDAIGELVLEGRRALETGDIKSVGELMNINHGLLYALGVSTPRVEQIVQVARGAGALGSKLTGGGMGGSVVCICPDDNTLESVVSAIRVAGYTAFGVTEDRYGVMLEGKS